MKGPNDSEPGWVDDADDPLVGTVLNGAYKIQHKLGEGAMGAVYKADQLNVGRQVAIKVLRPDIPIPREKRAELTKRFRREAKATSRLSHPNSVRLIEFGETEAGMLFLVLEFLEGLTLRDAVAQQAPLDPKRVARIALQITKALSEAHGLGIVHRDLKPDNVFLCRYAGEPDFVKVVDFGIARMAEAAEGATALTRTGLTIGTPIYMSPEQAMAQEITPASDLYALGVMLYEMLTGAPPFDADSAMALGIKHITEDPPELEIPGLPEPLLAEWRDLVSRLLKKKPEERPQTVEEVVGLLAALAEGTPAGLAGKRTGPPLGITHSEPVETAGGMAIEPPRKAKRVWVAAAAVLLLSGVGAALALGGGDKPADGTTQDASARQASEAHAASERGEAPVETAADLRVGEAAAPKADPGEQEPEPDPVAEGQPDEPAQPAVGEAKGDGEGEEPEDAEAVQLGALEILPDPEEDPKVVQVKLTLWPKRASVRRGDAVVCEGTPCELEIPVEAGATADLVVEQRGFVTETLSIPLDEEARVSKKVALERYKRRPTGKSAKSDKPNKPPPSGASEGVTGLLDKATKSADKATKAAEKVKKTLLPGIRTDSTKKKLPGGRTD